MRWTDLPVVGGAYSDDSKPWSVQDTVNWIPEVAERPGGRSPSMLRTAPGFSVFAGGADGPVRGLHDVEGSLLAVIGPTLYRMLPTGALVNVGTIANVGRVSMAHNQITGGNEVVIATGGVSYVYNTATALLTQISDEGFPGAKVVDFVDGYIVGVEPQGRYWFHSDLADATSYNTLDRSEAEAQPDRIVSLICTHRDVLVFGERSAEFFYNTGEATGTFARRDGTEMEVGCAGKFAAARIDNSVCWLGHDGSFYRLNGYQPVRISTAAVEQAVSRFTWSDCFATVYEDRGHKIVYWTFTDGQTFGFDVATQEWHRRESKGLSRWRLSALARWNRQWIGGDYVTGDLVLLDWDVPTEAGQEMERRRITSVLHDQQNRIGLNALELLFNTRQAPATSSGSDLVLTPPTISGDAQDSEIDILYTYSYTVTGTEPLLVSVIAGALPPGLAISTAGVITGTPTTEGTYNFTLRVTDENGLFDELEDTITVSELFLVLGSTNTGTSETSLVVNLPTYAIGDLLIMSLAHGILAGPGSVTTPTGWTAFGTETGFRLEARWYWRLADGSEGASVAVTTDTGHSTAQVHRVLAGEFDPMVPPEISTTSGPGDGIDIDPPSLTPSWAVANTIWLVTSPTLYNDVGAAAVTYPYPPGVATVPGFSGTFTTMVSSCGTRETTATLDPGVFDSNGGSTKAAATIGIKPA